MDDVELVQVLNRQHDFGEVEPRSVLLEVDLIVEHATQVAPRQVFQDEHVGLSLGEGERGADQMVSCYFFEYLVLVLDCLKLLTVVSLESHHFQRIEIASLGPPHQIHPPEGSLAQKLEQLEVLKRHCQRLLLLQSDVLQ